MDRTQAQASASFWWQVMRNALRIFNENNAFSYAGALAFYTLFSLAPVVIIAVSVTGVVLGEEAAQGQIVAQLEGIMGTGAAATVEQAVANSRIENSGLLPTLLGVAALIVGATTVFAQMQYSLNTIWGVTAKPSRNSILALVQSRLLSLTVVLAIGFVLLVSLLAGVALRAVIHFADNYMPVLGALLSAGELVLSFAMVGLLFGCIFKVLPDVVLSWREVVIGAAVTAVLFSIGRYGIAAYLAYTATASTYGAAGSVVLILLWVYYSSLILLFGAAFTKAHLLARGRPLVPRDTAVVVRREFITE